MSLARAAERLRLVAEVEFVEEWAQPSSGTRGAASEARVAWKRNDRRRMSLCRTNGEEFKFGLTKAQLRNGADAKDGGDVGKPTGGVRR